MTAVSPVCAWLAIEHLMNSMKPVIPLHFISWKKTHFVILAGSAFYQLWFGRRPLQSFLISENEFTHEIKCHGMTSFMDFMLSVGETGLYSRAYYSQLNPSWCVDCSDRRDLVPAGLLIFMMLISMRPTCPYIDAPVILHIYTSPQATSLLLPYYYLPLSCEKMALSIQRVYIVSGTAAIGQPSLMRFWMFVSPKS